MRSTAAGTRSRRAASAIVRQQMQRIRRPRRKDSATVLALLTICAYVALIALPEIILSTLPIVLFLLPFSYFIHNARVNRRLDLLSRHEVLADSDKLIELNETGEIIAEIDLLEDYTVSSPLKTSTDAVYQVRQDEEVLEISTRSDNARHLVQKVLGIKTWAPDMPWNH